MCENRDNTKENDLSLKSIRELLGEKFFVPSYQRGYRWTKQEVEDLLDDIYEFKKEENGGEFYCLQPLVVKKMTGTAEEKLNRLLTEEELKNLTEEGKKKVLEEKWLEVIDGQQRLTTIFIILKYLQKEYLQKNELQESSKKDLDKILNGKSLYSLVYETRKEINGEKGHENRKGSKKFLENIETLADSGDAEENIDFFHMGWAYKTIDGWFKKTIDGWFKKSKPSEDSVPTVEFLRKLLEKPLDDVQFIWYETDESDPIKVFTRLNIGKIPLTNAELIKALFLNSSNFLEKDDHLKLRQREIASEWDRIEYTLQNEEFWLFIHNKGYNNPTRIDFIFDIICERESDPVNTTGIDSYRTFRHFYKSFKNAKKARKCIKKARKCIKKARKCIEDAKNNTEDAKKHIEEAKKLIEDVKWKTVLEKICDVDEVEEEIEKCDTIYRWKEVKKIFQTFNEWFNDLELYHYVGYLVAGGEKIKGLYKDWTESNDKNDFVENKLKKKIKEKIEKINNLGMQYKFDSGTEPGGVNAPGADKTSVKRKKLPDKKECHSLLLLHNIQTVINQCKNSTEAYGMQVFHKFPFHIYKNESWDVEHIDSNTPNDLDTPEDQRGWLIATHDKVKHIVNSNIERADESEKEALEKEIEGIKDLYRDLGKGKKNEFENIKRKIEEKFLEGEETFSDDEETTKEEKKNQIWNFALLDSSTNRGYGNSIFSAKRRCIIGKDKGKEIILPDEWDGELKEEDAESSFIPPCTKYVFLKYYSPASSSDPNYWTVDDAKKYRDNIFETLGEFGVKNADESAKNANKGDEDEQK